MVSAPEKTAFGPRNITVVTGGRSDYGVLVPLLRAIDADPALDLRLWVTGAHFARQFGSTIDELIRDGFHIDETIDMLLASDSPEAIAKSVGVGVLGFAQSFARRRPDILVGLGDRFELIAAVQAALPFNIPVGHISGGEITEGAMDESIRHAITKLSHLHFVSAEPYARRVIQMGEEPWRVHVTGDPGLDNIASMSFLGQADLENLLGMPLSPPPILVTFHPVTLERQQNVTHIAKLLAALRHLPHPVVFTYPNADTGGAAIIEAIERYTASTPNVRAMPNLGRRAYCSLMKFAAAMVGNSSSGIIEAASFELPVVNVGNRQRGRLANSNVIHCSPEEEAIVQAIREAVSPEFRGRVHGIRNLYGDGHASERIVSVLKSVSLDQNLIVKRFHDLV